MQENITNSCIFHFGHTGVNMTETGNSSWKTKHPLKLVDTCKDDITAMIVQEEEFLQFVEDNGLFSGSGLTMYVE